MSISIAIPARDEPAFRGKCVESIAASARKAGMDHERMVVLNRCTDESERIALEHGCRVVHEGPRNLSRVRSRGAEVGRFDEFYDDAPTGGSAPRRRLHQGSLRWTYALMLVSLTSCITDEPWSFSLTRALLEPLGDETIDLGPVDMDAMNPFLCLLAVPIGLDVLLLPMTFTLDVAEFFDKASRSSPGAADTPWLGEAVDNEVER